MFDLFEKLYVWAICTDVFEEAVPDVQESEEIIWSNNEKEEL